MTAKVEHWPRRMVAARKKLLDAVGDACLCATVVEKTMAFGADSQCVEGLVRSADALVRARREYSEVKAEQFLRHTEAQDP